MSASIVNRRNFLKTVGASIAVAGVAASVYYLAGGHAPSTTITEGPTTIQTSYETTTATTTYSRQGMLDFWKGVMFVQWLRRNDRSIKPGMRELKKRIPSNVISLWVPYYTESPTSDRIFPIYDASGYGGLYGFQLDESWPPALIESTFDLAHELGLGVAYWPNVGPVTHGLAWEGALDPTPEVLEAYRQFKAEQATLAEKHQCEMFWVGNEWNQSYLHGEEWKSILGAIRDRFSGAIAIEFLYCDWGWWEYVLNRVDERCFESTDYVGLSMNIFPMASENTSGTEPCDPAYYSPTVSQLIEGWRKPMEAVEEAYRKFEKPILITELSASSYDGAACEDWRFQPSKSMMSRLVDFQEQADLFEATMRVMTGLECVHGVSWNNWNAFEPGLFYRMAGFDEREIQFQGKPAEKVLRYWYSKKNIRDGVGLLLTPNGHVDLGNLGKENPLNERGGIC
jgi:hypothetical protein